MQRYAPGAVCSDFIHPQTRGKRLRPFLVLASCDMFGGDIEDAVHPAIAIEIFHNFTLLHDDLMDQAPLRRGKETVYKNGMPIWPSLQEIPCLPLPIAT
ncbi:MAG: polyprenyl synthetase family protein [Bacteroidales bacterium]|nr:polyprenyl synthetase family protein [Bacteroidales bacterium]